MINLVLYMRKVDLDNGGKFQEGKTLEEKTETITIPVDDTIARHISELMLYKQEDKVKEYFKTLKDIDGEVYNIDFDKVLGFEFKQA